MNISHVGDGSVQLLAGGGRIYSEAVAHFCRSEKSVDEIIAEPYLKNLLKDLIESRHKAALEFDRYIFGVSGYARVTEVQLVRKRLASYMIKSGRPNFGGKRQYNVVLPKSVMDIATTHSVELDRIYIEGENGVSESLIKYMLDKDWGDQVVEDLTGKNTFICLDTMEILDILESWYTSGIDEQIPEEELRYMKPQATEFRAAIMMNAAGLYDWFQIRMCNRAQTEIRDLATKMYKCVMAVHPDIFESMGPACKVLGYCPESHQCEQFKGKIPTKKEALELIRTQYNPDIP